MRPATHAADRHTPAPSTPERPRRLLVAAGGGGDALTAAALAHALYGPDTPTLVLTWAWERLVVDPVPGPRGRADFTGLREPAPGVLLFTPDTRPVAPAGSLLPRLSGELPCALGLLDPHQGVAGLTDTLRAAAEWCGAERIDVVDVGGDILARGDEPTLRSPLGDALVLAAARRTGLPTDVYVAGPALDNEVPRAELLPRLGPAALRLTAEHTAALLPLFAWHPSEASALLVAAARGLRARCGTRDAPAPVDLDAASAGVHRLPLDAALALNPLARALLDADPVDLPGAEAVSEKVCGFSEVARERERAARGEGLPPAPAPARAPDAGALTARYAAWEAGPRAAGIACVTRRLVVEELGLEPAERDLLLDLLGAADRPEAPLLRLRP
ncbi:DUF1152 domain-containing protein [Streptomyces sp. BI20]|uniref:DUF1152 domain-containing protein n=1 Tax=Streptomyces sp. BI20 TaxID=3403460 RepID=UPI003C765050